MRKRTLSFKLTMSTDNEAFADMRTETARILRAIADRLDGGSIFGGKCRDINGNVVGSFEFVEE